MKSTPGAVKRILQVIDADGNGTIEFEEFVTFFAKDKDELKALLNKTSRRFQDYKSESLTDPGFGNRYKVPPSVKSKYGCEGHNEVVETVKFLTKDFFVSGSLDATVKVWDVATGKVRSSTMFDHAVYSLCALSNTMLLVGMGSGEFAVAVYDVNSGKATSEGLERHGNSSV